MIVTMEQQIIETTRSAFAISGYEGISMRVLAKKIGIAPSVFYYYFANKNSLLKSMYVYTNTQLGKLREQLPECISFEEMLIQRIHFQFEHAEKITAVLKYYFHFRNDFEKNERGHLPEKTYLHIEEVLLFGEASGQYKFTNLKREAKLIVHAINGFILEYYPRKLHQKEEKELVDTLSEFILRAIHSFKV